MEEKKYKNLYLEANTKIDEAVRRLQDCKERGELACIEFDGVTLYSDTVTLDDAYLEITGYTKNDYEKWLKNAREARKRETEAYRASIPELTGKYIQKGHDILDEKYWKEWDAYVPKSLNGIYEGLELGNCLEIVESLNNRNSLAETKELIDKQNHSGASYYMVRGMVCSFCDRGQEFGDYLDGKIKDFSNNRKKYDEYEKDDNNR